MFESLLMQSSAVTDSVALVIAITTAIGTVGALVASISAKIKQVSHSQRIDKIADEAQSIGQLATAFAQKTAEQQDELKTVADVITNLSPDAKKLLEDQQKNMEYWRDRANAADQQIKRLLPLVPGDAQANNIPNLPRENTKNLGAVNRV
jgi:hypothetical protein